MSCSNLPSITIPSSTSNNVITEDVSNLGLTVSNKYRFSSLTDDYIDMIVDEKVKTRFANLPKFDKRYNLVLTGTVGAGKSTRLDIMSRLLEVNHQNVHNFVEYLNMPFGKELFNGFIHNQLSALTFQSFVLDGWNYSGKQNAINLYERCCDDSVVCFCTNHYYNGKMTKEEVNTLFNKMKSIVTEHDYPTYTRPYNFTPIDSTDINSNLLQIADIMECDYNNGVTNRIIGLRVPSEVSMSRIRSRNRKGEENYDDKYVWQMNRWYSELFMFAEMKNILTEPFALTTGIYFDSSDMKDKTVTKEDEEAERSD